MDKRTSISIAGTSLLILLFLVSCNPDPSIETLLNFSMNFQNTAGQRFSPGDKVDVLLTARNNLVENDYLRIEFVIASGGGTLSKSSVITDSLGEARTEWTIGNVSTGNILDALMFDSRGVYITHTSLLASCLLPDMWNEMSDNSPDKNIRGMVADTVNKFTIMLAGNDLYRQGDRYYRWDKLPNPGISFRTIDINSKGVIYASTWTGELLKSTDHGQTWNMCTKPYPLVPYFIYVCMANDDYIWVGRPDSPVKFSKDGGMTWQTGPSDLPYFITGNVFRMKDGTIVCHGTKNPDKLRLHYSVDNGITWNVRETPNYSTNMFVTKNDEIIIVNQENGVTFLKTTDLGLTYTRIHSVNVGWRTTMERSIFNRWKNFYYVIVPGYGILKSYDLLHYEPFSSSTSFRDLFVDHNGVLIALDINYNKVYYRQNTQ
jgi:photosystem II stability/assembly factor-like uncharacterized protein